MSRQPNTIHRLFGVRGWGSSIVEAALVLAEAPFEFEDVDGFDAPGAARDTLLSVNPLAQVPTLVLPDGTVMTESAAMVLHLSEAFPDAGLAPAPEAPERPQFLRRLVWLVAAVYSKSTYDDYPERFAPSAASELREAVAHQREELWRQWEAEMEPSPWSLGERFSALDLYVGVMTRWRPRRPWFDANCPRIASVARAVDKLPALRSVWQRNFPESDE